MLGRLGLMLAIGAMMVGGAVHASLRVALAWISSVGLLWLRRALGVILALVVLFAEWGWRPLAALLGQLRRLAPIARLENWVQTLSPYAALVAFLLPSLFLLPLKLLALYLIAHGQKLAALGLFAIAKIGGTAIVARLFMLTSPQLLRIAWFARGYHLIMPWKEALFAQIRASWAWRYGRMLKSKVRQLARRAWAAGRPVIARLIQAARDRGRLWWRRRVG